MGEVIPLDTRAKRRAIEGRGAANTLNSADAELALITAARDGCDKRGILASASPLLEQCRDRYGFTVMQSGLPHSPEVLVCALLTLARALRPLDAELGGRRPFWAYGVYFVEQQELSWFEDGYGGTTGLAVPIGIDGAELTRFVQQRFRTLWC
jgi:hypothetical protein